MQSKTNVKTGGGDPSDKANRTQTMAHYPNSERRNSRFKISWRFPRLLVLALAAIGSFVILASSALAETSAANEPGSATACDTRLLRGDYGFSFSGSFSHGATFTGVGSESCNDQGQCTGVTTINIGGTTSIAPFTSVYTINADCTGVETANYYDLGLVVSESVVLVDGGKEVHFIGTDPGGTSIGVMKRR